MKPSICFKSFSEIVDLKENEPLLKILKDRDKYFAHTHKNKSKETLDQHLKLVTAYFLKLVKEHYLEKIVDNLIVKSIPEGFSDKVKMGNFIKESFFKTILYHDFGKINHLFQEKKMQNLRSDFKIVRHKVDSQHSIISAYIYLMHLLDSEILAFNELEQVFIDTIVSSFAYPIVKHHAKYLDSVVDTDFNEQTNFFVEYLELFECEKPQNIDLLHEIATKIETTFRQFDNLEVDHFPIYALLKLNFSLLTASDYYATGEYAQNLKVDDFGLIAGKFRDDIIDSFKTTKSYNEELFADTDKLINIPFEQLNERNEDNLNSLRKKLAAEALTNIRKYSDSNLFYLEAPTGAGKTNVSLAIAIELLEKDSVLNKVFYVFPFTTLVTQTFDSIKNILKTNNEHIIQLHSKSGFHQQNEKENDGNYGENRLNFINNHFVNYPITLLTHIKFFDVLKGNSKENNYIFHRLANSIVIIDELQTYNPKHWDKTIYFLSKYAKLFNMKIILMSATLPKIGRLLSDQDLAKEIKYLISWESKPLYFRNKNFAGRVEFDFSLLDKWNWQSPRGDEARKRYLEELAQKVYDESEMYARDVSKKRGAVRTLIEFITKKSASQFFRKIQENDQFKDYKLYLISGEILDPRRRHIINAIKDNKDRKVILVTTQVIEAGVDIDMDLGFKDRSLIDSDEQLAGRVNRNASKDHCKIFMFDYDQEAFVYRGDPRLKIDDLKKRDTYKNILQTKDFDSDFYNLVQDKITKDNRNEAVNNLSEYLRAFKRFNFKAINQGFQLIEQDNESVFVPLPIPKEDFSEEDLKTFKSIHISEYSVKDKLCFSGKDVWLRYVDIVTESHDKKKTYFENQTQLKQIYGLLSKFMFSVFSQQAESLKEFSDYNEEQSTYKQYGIYYLSMWQEIYSYENGLDINKVENGGIFL